jgi:hypothetical protein
MNLSLDDDSIRVHLVRLLITDGHNVQQPAQAGLAGQDDSVHLRHVIRCDRVLLTHNYKDFNNLHELILDAGGQRRAGNLPRRKGRGTRGLVGGRLILHP